MRPLPGARTAVAYSGVALVLCAVWFGSWLMWRWLGLLGVTLVGLALMVGRAPWSRRYGAALGASLLLCGAVFEIPKVWVERPPWVDGTAATMLAVSVAWFLVELGRSKRREL